MRSCFAVYSYTCVQYRYLPYDPEHKGVPVTRWTATPGMLVRRGYDVIAGEEDAAAAGEVRGVRGYMTVLMAGSMCSCRQRNLAHFT